jgi:hypothetical protein
VALRSAGQEQSRPQRIAVHRGKRDVVDENVVQRSFNQRDFPVLSRPPGKSEFDFCYKGLSLRPRLFSEVLGGCARK